METAYGETTQPFANDMLLTIEGRIFTTQRNGARPLLVASPAFVQMKTIRKRETGSANKSWHSELTTKSMPLERNLRW
jgi:hypothetical protein